MNILFNASPAVRPVTGIGTYAKELIRHLLQIDKQNRYTIFSIRSPIPTENLSFYYPNNENVSYKSFVFPYRYLNILWNNFNILPIEKFLGKADILHSLDRIAPFTRSTKIIITIHDMSWYVFGKNERRRNIIYKQVTETIKRASAVITDSEFSKEEIMKYLPFARDKLYSISLGVSDRFRPIDKGEIPQAINKRYPWDDYILYIGLLDDPRKNIESIVNSYADLKKRKKIKEKLVLCGCIPTNDEYLMRIIKKANMPNDIIVYLKWIPDDEIPYIYNKARLVLLPSLYEGFGLPVLEAMACGKPVITSDISPLREVASDAAVLINPKIQKELADSIERVSSDSKLYDALVEKGLKRSKEFTWIKTAQETLKIYEKYGAE